MVGILDANLSSYLHYVFTMVHVCSLDVNLGASLDYFFIMVKMANLNDN